jgi:hypothetical protein
MLPQRRWSTLTIAADCPRSLAGSPVGSKRAADLMTSGGGTCSDRGRHGRCIGAPQPGRPSASAGARGAPLLEQGAENTNPPRGSCSNDHEELRFVDFIKKLRSHRAGPSSMGVERPASSAQGEPQIRPTAARVHMQNQPVTNSLRRISDIAVGFLAFLLHAGSDILQNEERRRTGRIAGISDLAPCQRTNGERIDTPVPTTCLS